MGASSVASALHLDPVGRLRLARIPVRMPKTIARRSFAPYISDRAMRFRRRHPFLPGGRCAAAYRNGYICSGSKANPAPLQCSASGHRGHSTPTLPRRCIRLRRCPLRPPSFGTSLRRPLRNGACRTARIFFRRESKDAACAAACSDGRFGIRGRRRQSGVPFHPKRSRPVSRSLGSPAVYDRDRMVSPGAPAPRSLKTHPRAPTSSPFQGIAVRHKQSRRQTGQRVLRRGAQIEFPFSQYSQQGPSAYNRLRIT